MSSKTKRFNPNEHLRQFERRQKQLDGSYATVTIDYLDVKWRIVWFREEHPEGTINTELLSTPGVSPAVVRATVTLANGVSATGLGQCDEESWGDWLEKAETRSIGRALALLGYGTQFCEEFDEIISDSPVESRRQRPASQSSGRSGSSSSETPMTPNQRGFIDALARDSGMDADQLDALAQEKFQRSFSELLKFQASEMIETLQSMKEERSASLTTSPN